jgi:hypothetical protein
VLPSNHILLLFCDVPQAAAARWAAKGQSRTAVAAARAERTAKAAPQDDGASGTRNAAAAAVLPRKRHQAVGSVAALLAYFEILARNVPPVSFFASFTSNVFVLNSID